MTVTPTPAEFLAAQTADDEDDEAVHVDPLVSIAESMRAIAAALEGQHQPCADGDDGEGLTVPAVDLEELEAEYREVESLHDAKQALIEQVLALCKPSTSKLANSIRIVLEPVVAPSGPTYRYDTSEEEAPADGDEPAQESPGTGRFPPAADADVVEWRAFARSHGYAGPDVDRANRAQIRTMLGLEQPVSTEADR